MIVQGESNLKFVWFMMSQCGNTPSITDIKKFILPGLLLPTRVSYVYTEVTLSLLFFFTVCYDKRGSIFCELNIINNWEVCRQPPHFSVNTEISSGP